MAYIKQNFKDGQVLNAANLNKIEQGIEDVMNLIEEHINDGGGSAIRKHMVSLTVSGWIATSSQTVNVPGISADETSQLIHILPVDETAYTNAGIDVEVVSDGVMKFTAETIPAVDLVVAVVIEDIGAAVNGEVVVGPETKVFIATVPVNWTQSGNFYYQDIAVDGMSEKYSPIVNCLYGNDQEMNAQYKAAFGLVHDVDTFDNSVRIWCTAAPTMEFTVKFTIMGWYSVDPSVLTPAEGVEF